MRQVLLTNQGRVQVVDVPAPRLRPGHVLVRTAYSLISPGTETAALRHYSAGLLARTAARPELLRSVAQQIGSTGVAATVRQIAGRLSDMSPLGYSLAGTVMEVGSGVPEVNAGDHVACMGAEYAHHAEIVAVPRHLVAVVPEDVSLRLAACAGVGAIALQAVRRSQAALGETVVVIGLGLVGHLVSQLLLASGCRVIAVEPRTARAELGRRLGIPHVLPPDAPDLGATVLELTGGIGADAVVLCAATASSAPVNHAFAVARERGRVVVVGDVGLDLERADFYAKELDLVMSRSAGPGRYDVAYEQQGIDYPVGHVRWTEQRNLVAFLQLLSNRRVDILPLISDEVAIEEAAMSYEHLHAGEDTLGVLLRYPGSAQAAPSIFLPPRRPVPVTSRSHSRRIAVGLIGAGAFARSVHLPILNGSRGLAVRAVVSPRAVGARNAGVQARATYVSTDPVTPIADPEIEVIWITTPHDSHAELAIRALEAGKHVFVEKPLALTLADCHRVRRAVAASGRLLTVGFNRRFAPASVAVRNHFAGVPGPRQVIYRVRADTLPVGHWLDDPQRGGGRLLGEGCHFFDWMAWLLGEEPETVWTARAGEGDENVTVTIEFSGGSTGTLVYTVTGAKETPKERIEVFAAGRTAVVENFETVELLGSGGPHRRLRLRGKGYQEEVAAFELALRGRASLAVTVDDGLRATACALAALAALRQGGPVVVSLAEPCVESPE